MSQCQYPRCCGRATKLRWLGKVLCLRHWRAISKMDSDEAKKRLKIENQPTGAPA